MACPVASAAEDATCSTVASCLTGVSSEVRAAPARTPATKVTGLDAIV
jgi:hypothetical protein